VELFEIIIGLAVCFAVSAFFILLFADVLGWFEARSTLRASDADNIAVTIKECWDSGNYRTVQGVFNTRTSQLADARRVKSQDVDDELRRLHADKPMVVYQE